jgi:hypothetical protein
LDVYDRAAVRYPSSVTRIKGRKGDLLLLGLEGKMENMYDERKGVVVYKSSWRKMNKRLVKKGVSGRTSTTVVVSNESRCCSRKGENVKSLGRSSK